VGIFLGFPRERWTLLWELTISGWPNDWITIKWQCFIKSDSRYLWVYNIMGYLSHKWPRLCSVCRNHNLTLSILMNYQWVCNNECMRLSPICRFVHSVFTSLCVILSFFLLAIVLSVFLRLTAYADHVGIFKLFFQCHMAWVFVCCQYSFC
jgi:hypothetical protein